MEMPCTLCGRTNGIAGTTWTARALQGHTEFPPVMTHCENGIQVTAVTNITSSRSKRIQLLELPTSGSRQVASSHARHTL